ncbi:T9SS type A sorting domain-containing protein [Hymenobacter sp. 102]|uniref:T9SS type A sorting domain-containing protein n=1 Tax=Hymenobacter sp. 102 TaxID=3403152 RepID=UPI003CF9B154
MLQLALIALCSAETASAQSLQKVTSVTTSGGPTGLDSKANYLYLANFGSSSLETLDITNPESPVSKSTVSTTAFNRIRQVTVGGDRLYGTHFGTGSSSSSQLTGFSLQNPATPGAPAGTTITGNPLNVGASATVVCITTSTTSTPPVTYFQPFSPDLTPGAKVTLDAYQISKPAVNGNIAYVRDGSVLKVFDVSNPQQPILRQSTTGYIQAINGNKGYGVLNGVLQVYDLSTPEIPVAQGSVAIPSGTTLSDIAVSGTMVYGYFAASGGASSFTLQAFDVSNPASPTVKGTLTGTGTAYDIAGVGNYAYVLTDGSALQIFRYQNVAAATVASVAPASGSPGTTVTITGSEFTGATAVKFNGKDAASFTVISSNSITAVVPAGATTGPVTVTTPSGTASSSGSFVVTVAAISNNTIAGPSPDAFCGSGDPGVITGQVPAGGDGTYTYQWQSSSDNTAFANLAGATAASYDPPTLSQTIYYRRTVSSGGQTSTSNTITVAVQPVLAGNSLTAPQPAVFTGPADPGVISGSQPTGGNNQYSYQWQSSADNSTFISIAGAVSQSYDPPLLSQTTYFRRLVVSGACQAFNISNTITVTIQTVTTSASAALAGQVELVPNPARENVHVSMPLIGAGGVIRCDIVNGLGQVVQQRTLTMSSTGLKTTLDMHRLPAGLYFVQLRGNGLYVNKRLQIE